MSRRTGRICVALELRDVRALEDDLAARRLDELDDRPAERRLAAAGLADDAERLAAHDRQVDPVHGAHLADRVLEDAGLDREPLDETLDAEDLVRIAARRDADRRPRRRSSLTTIAPRWPPGSARRASAPRRSDRPEMCVLVVARTVAAPGPPSRHRARPCEWTQRGWNAQPGGGVTRLGGWPGIGSSHSCSPSSRARLFIEPDGVRMAWSVEDRKDVAELDDPARVHDHDAVGELRDHAEVVRDQDCRRVRLALSGPQHLDDLRLDRHVERSRRLVGDQDRRRVGDRHRDHAALSHATRELVRVLVDRAVRDAGHRRARVARSRGASPRPRRPPSIVRA